jgi:hypothetical protein
MKRLKADLHLHTKEDPQDSVKYNARELRLNEGHFPYF